MTTNASHSGKTLAVLWGVLLLAFVVSVRRSPLFTGAAPRGDGLEAMLGAPVVVDLPLLAVASLTVVLTVRWLRSRKRTA